MRSIALFPIPDCVAFPGTQFPLHVFEPRYRAMVKYCIDTNTYLAICHTQKRIHAPKSGQSIAESLNSNQATYLPYKIFSAGECQLVETLEDGRMYVNIHLKQRFQAKEEVQTLPFSIWHCEEYNDRDVIYDKTEAEQFKQKILARLIILTKDSKELSNMLKSQEWIEKNVISFSFEVFSLVRFPGNYLQNILEKQNVLERLQATLEFLNSNG